MPRLANDRNELYCRHRAKGMIPSKAALAAGYAAGSSTTHLEQDPEVVARIGELMDEMKQQREAQRQAAIEAAKVVGQMTGVGRSWVIQQLAEVAQLAKQEADFAQANRALELIGKDFGMFNGGSGEDPATNVPQTLDLDKLGALLSEATEALPPPTVDESRNFSEDTAMRLIEGQVKPKDRVLSTGSETDVALRMETMDDPREDGDEPWAEPADPQVERDEFAALRAELDADEG